MENCDRGNLSVLFDDNLLRFRLTIVASIGGFATCAMRMHVAWSQRHMSEHMSVLIFIFSTASGRGVTRRARSKVTE